MTIAIALLVLFVIAAFALRETMHQDRVREDEPEPPTPEEPTTPITDDVEPPAAGTDDVEPATHTAVVAVAVAESETVPPSQDILPADAPVTEVIEDGHLIATRVVLPVEPHERARAVFKLALVLVFVAGACGGLLLLIGRMVGDYFSRFAG